MSGAGERHLLVVDDDDRIRDLLKEFLTRAGFRVSAAADANAAKRLMQAFDFDLLVFDVMMPGEEPARQTPVLMLTARDAAEDRIAGLTLGADDYLAKPFEPQELLLRIEAILRRAGARPTGGGRLSLGACSFDLDRGELTCSDAPVKLTEAEARLLRRLAANAHAPVDRLVLARETADPSGRAMSRSPACAARSRPIPRRRAICRPCAGSAICWRRTDNGPCPSPA